MSSRYLQGMSSRHLQGMYLRRLQDMSSRRLQDMSSRRFKDMSSRPINICWVVTTLCFQRRFSDRLLKLQQCRDSEVIFLAKI